MSNSEWLVPEAVKGAGFVTIGVFRGVGKNDKGYPFVQVEHVRPNGTEWVQRPQFDAENRSTGEATKIAQQLGEIREGDPVAVVVDDVNAMVPGKSAWYKAVAIVRVQVVEVDDPPVAGSGKA